MNLNFNKIKIKCIIFYASSAIYRRFLEYIGKYVTTEWIVDSTVCVKRFSLTNNKHW